MSDEEDLKHFAGKLKGSRKKAKLAQGIVAKECGISVSNLSNVEQGRNWPSGPIMYRLCRRLKIRVP